MHGALAIARFALLEARRSPLPWLAGAALAAALALAAFVSQVAIAEGTKVQASVTAALLRAAAVFLVATHVVASIAREANDRVLDFVLASALSRPAWYLGKLAGFAVAGAILAVAFAAPLLLWAAPGAVAAWALSLALECMLVGAAGLYLLGRSIGAIQAIASGPIAPQGVGGRAAEWAVEALALLLPRLDAVSRSAWLLYDPPSAAEFGAAGAVLVAYTALLAAAGLFDLARRSL